MSELNDQIEAAIHRHKLLRVGQAVLVAVSGGLDSMVLLHTLRELSLRHRWRLTVAHFNHRLRGRSSGADQRLVRKVAETLQLPLVAGRADVRGKARRQGISLEMAARQLRHEFLARSAREQRIRTIALAHHADDQVELFFLRLLRGASSGGLAGMKWRSPSPADPRISLIRPLLDQPKAVLAEFAREERISFRQDASNASLEMIRNRIRHELLPRLQRQFQPALTKVILRQMDLLGAESLCLEEQARAYLQGQGAPPFPQLPLALQRRVLQLQLIEQGIEPAFELIERLRQRSNQAVTVLPQLQLVRDPSGRLRAQAMPPVEFQTGVRRLRLGTPNGPVAFGGARFQWRLQTRPPANRFRSVAGSEWFDADRVGREVVLRRWRPGDRFQPIGMASPVKLQDLFTNLKIPRAARHQRVVATTAGGELWWVEGLRIGEKFKLSKATRRVLHWQWRRER